MLQTTNISGPNIVLTDGNKHTLSRSCALKARGGRGEVEGQKCPILIFQYVIELDEANQMQKT